MKQARYIIFVGTIALALGACGNRQDLKPLANKDLPVAPRGAEQPKTAEQLLEPTPQARPERTVELLRRSEEREDDEFELPPE